MRTTIKDIAKLLGVSHSTVSRALHDSTEIGEAMKLKVRSAAKKMNYRPNALARSLVKKKSETVGIIVPDLENPFYANLCKNLVRKLEEKSYNALICNSDREIGKEKKYLSYLQEQQTDGVVMIPADVEQEYFQKAMHSGLIFVLLDHSGEGIDVDTVMTDNYHGARVATEHLVNLGYEKIAHIGGPKLASPSHDRLRGYLDVLDERGLGESYSRIAYTDTTFSGGIAAARELVEKGEMPDAVFAVNDVTAIGALQYFFDRGIRVPEEIALVGFDDISMAKMLPVPLTTVRQSAEEIASIATELFLERIRLCREGIKKNVLLTPKLIVRDSCGERTRIKNHFTVTSFPTSADR